MSRPFRIYYDDGTVWSHGDGPWDAAPHDGVQVIMLANTPAGNEIVQGDDVYPPPPGVDGTQVKRGRWMPDDAYAALVEQAIVDGTP